MPRQKETGWKGAFVPPISTLGTRKVGVPERIWTSQNRYRATALSPDGKTVHVATDSSGLVRDVKTGAPTTKPTNPGAILTFRFQR